MSYINLEGEALIEELAGMIARRLAIAKYRAAGLSWSQARKASLNAVADKKIKYQIREALKQGMEPKDAMHLIAENNK